MKFPSVQSLFFNFLKVLKCFPFELVFALAGTCAAVHAISAKNDLFQVDSRLMQMAARIVIQHIKSH